MRVLLGLCVVLGVLCADPALAQPTGCLPVVPGVQDGTFEAGTPWPLWTIQTSSNFFTPICDLPDCGDGNGTAPPFAGTNWAWFGGIDWFEDATLGQTVTIPTGPFLFVRFQLRIGAVSTPFTDTLQVQVDGTPVETFTEPALAEAAYSLRYVNVTAFADGAPHVLSFAYSGPTTTLANFTVDDIELVSCTTPVSLQEFRAE